MKLAMGPKKIKDLPFSAWETILAEIIVGDAFGVDRMDYLLRDSHHAGVPYGRFDHHRLIDTLRILPSPPVPRAESKPVGNSLGDALASHLKSTTESSGQSAGSPPSANPAGPAQTTAHTPREPALGIEEGGLHSAAALMVARFFMYTQLYFHPVRRAYDIHLKDFLKDWLKDGCFSTDLAKHLEMTDNEVTAAVLDASRTPGRRGHAAAKRITGRGHFHVLYQRHPDDVHINRQAGKAIYHAACKQFGPERVRHDQYSQSGGAPDFPVLTRDGRIASSLAMSTTLTSLEAASFDFVFVDPAILPEAQPWLDANRRTIITPQEGQTNE